MIDNMRKRADIVGRRIEKKKKEKKKRERGASISSFPSFFFSFEFKLEKVGDGCDVVGKMAMAMMSIGQN